MGNYLEVQGFRPYNMYAVIIAPTITAMKNTKLLTAICRLPLSMWPLAQPLAILAPNSTR